MGTGFVIAVWLVIGTVLAVIASLALGVTVAALASGVAAKRRKATVIAFLYPFACLVWLLLVFALQAWVNTAFLGRDVGIGDVWACPLPNGYHLLMIDTTDDGTVYNPATQRGGGVCQQEDAPCRVQALQLAGRYVLGVRDTGDLGSRGPRSFFVLDTDTGKRADFPDRESVLATAGQLGVAFSPEPIGSVYNRFRYTWFDTFATCLAAAIPLVGIVFVARRAFGSCRSATDLA